MTEERFEEILKRNNQFLIQEMDKRIDNKIEEKLKKNNQYLIQQMNERMDKKFEDFEQKMNKKLEETDRKLNGKLAIFEKEYGEKISAIFDKIQLIDDIKKNTDYENKKYFERIENHDDLLYSHELRISELEDKVSSI
ncbi:MAG: hypothetical protein IJH39_07530 [Clostridia bacterium]|nr:hypothetical protein [Clostridia bacterium]